MNKAQLIESLAARLGDKKVAQHAIEGFIDIVERQVAKGEKVSITGFGTFEKVDRPARTARNPQTGQTVKVKKTSVPKFRPGRGLKDVASGVTKKGREPKHEPLLPEGIIRIVASATNAPTAPAAKKTTTPTRKAAAPKATAAPAKATARKAPAKKAPAAKTTAPKATATKAATARKAPAAKTTAPKATATKAATARKTPAKKVVAATATKATATKATTARKAPAKKAAARKATASK